MDLWLQVEPSQVIPSVLSPGMYHFPDDFLLCPLAKLLQIYLLEVLFLACYGFHFSFVLFRSTWVEQED